MCSEAQADKETNTMQMGIKGLARIGAGIALALALGACGSEKQQAPAGDTGTAADPAAASPAATVAAAAGAKPAAYAQCAACHSVEPGKHGIGPSMHGVYGTKAGEIAGYAFSEKLKASGLTWDDATLDQWLAGPMKMVPGTKMSFAGMSDPAKRAEIIAYMKTLK
jgi:cytochrome c